MVHLSVQTQGIGQQVPVRLDKLIDNIFESLINAMQHDVVNVLAYPFNLGRFPAPLTPAQLPTSRLRELAALIQRCALYVGNDTGPMHIAAAVGTRVVAIFGSTDARRSGPYGSKHVVISKAIGCNPCHPGPRPGGCKLGKCLAMEAVSIGQVSQMVERILSNGQE